MVQAYPQLMSLEEFLDWYPDGYGRYELWQGVALEMQPTGNHEQVAVFLGVKLGVEIERLNLPYLIPRQAIINPLDNPRSGYNPDLLVLDKLALQDEPLWAKRSTITQGATVRLVVEVVSTNWRDDYGHKLVDYEALGIAEYWIVDYLGLGGRRYIGSPKQPTFSIYHLVDKEYQVRQFSGSDRLVSPTFPELILTAKEVFSSSGLFG
jgi:Uma2 family endonuclease